MTVLSALGQPLRAEIELTAVSSDEVGQLNPKLASQDAFRQANIEFNAALYALHFAVEQRGSRQVISVTSVQPISDPFVDMLLEVGGSGGGHLVREYTFLLDPPSELQSRQAPEVSTTRPLASSRGSQSPAPVRVQPQPQPQPEEPTMSERPSQTARVPRAPQERPVRQAVAQQQPAPVQSTEQQGDYHVKSGDTLSKIAGKVKPEGVSLDQMLVALYRANQSAFIGNNMNRLRAGQMLSVPDAATAGAVGNAESHNVIVAQTADFNSYRNKLAGQVVNTEAQKSTEPRQSASGKITAKVEEKATPATEAKDKLKLSKAGVPGEKGGKIGAGEEDKIAKEKAIAEANARVKDLEKNVSDLQKVLEIKNKNLADQQKAEAAKAEAAKAEAAKAEAAKAAAKPAPAPTPASAPVVAATPAASAPAPVSKPAPEVKAEPVAPVAPPSKPPKPKPRPVPPPETSLFDDLIGNPFVLGGAAVLLLGLGGFGIYSGYRRRKEKSFGDSIITDSSLKANSLFGSTGGQSVDTNNSVFNSNFAPSASQLDSNEVDPVAEADVYIAYGRDAQAEEILKEALRTQPDRNAVRVKLLEIYANRKDVRSFEVMASELYGMTKGEGEDWQQAVSLGLSIDPKNPLYAAGKAPSEATTASHTQSPDEPNLDDLVPDTHTRPAMASPNTMEESPYFGSTTIGRLEPDTVARHPESQPKSHDGDLPLEVNTSLDFDLDGMDAEHIEMPEVVEPAPAPVAAAPAAPAENKMDFGNIDFDFIDNAPAKHAEPAAAREEEFPSIPTFAEPHVPSLSEVAATALDEAHEHKAPAPTEGKALDFDLSGITLELNPADKPAPVVAKAAGHDLNVPEIPSMDLHVPEIHAAETQVPDLPAMDLHLPHSHAAAETASASHAHSEAALDMLPDMMPPVHAESEVALDTNVDHEYSNDAEMATKLDLAVAYQEIGDKEGARELLEEVIQGGIAEHAGKAKALLAKMG